MPTIASRNVKFTYVPHSGRSGSFCEYGVGEHIERYEKDKALGTGSYGNVNLMLSRKSGKKIAVKVLPTKKYPVALTPEEIKTEFCQEQHMITQEAELNYKIHGVGAYFYTTDPFQVTTMHSIENDNVYQWKELTSHPHRYIAMAYVEGTVLKKLAIDSAEDFFSIFIAVMVAVQKLHDTYKIIHGDLHSNNVIIRTEGNQHVAHIIDFTLSRPPGNVIDTTDLELTIKPPEFKHPLVAADVSQDIYCCALMLSHFFKRSMFYPAIAERVDLLLRKMTRAAAQTRLGLDEALATIRTLSNTSLAYVELFREQQDLCENNFRDGNNIALWCVSEYYIFKIRSRDINTLDFNQIDSSYHGVASKNVRIANRGFKLLIPVMETEDYLMTVLCQLRAENRWALLNFIYSNDKVLLAALVKDEAYYNALAALFTDKLAFLRILLASRSLALLPLFDSENADQRILAIDQWLYCQQFLTELQIDSGRDFETRQFHYPLVLKPWTSTFGKKKFADDLPAAHRLISAMKVLSLHHKMLVINHLGSSELKDLIQNCGELLNLTTTLVTIENKKILLNHLTILHLKTFKYADLASRPTQEIAEFITLIKQIDVPLCLQITRDLCLEWSRRDNSVGAVVARISRKFPVEINPTVYQQLIQGCNEAYRVKRNKDQREFFSIFSRHSKADKVDASERLATAMQTSNFNDPVFRQQELLQGELGQIAQAYLKLGRF
jgi:serine/threonine protein kinase